MFWAFTEMGLELVVSRREAVGVGDGCHHVGRAVHGLGYQCGLSWLCHSGGLASSGG